MRSRNALWIAAVVAFGAFGSACTPGWQLPDRADDAVKAEEVRLAAVFQDSEEIFGVAGGRCEVRLLGREGETSYAWAHCRRKGSGETSLPVRIDGTSVSTPGDGQQFGEDVERMFPPGLADRIFNDPESLRP